MQFNKLGLLLMVAKERAHYGEGPRKVEISSRLVLLENKN